MTALADQLIQRIVRSGPITIADYMAECLMHPQYGYYTTQDPFGGDGDFITAPEISQMFGELVGLTLAQSWIDQGQPSPFSIAELGPGRGTLMADALRATRSVPGFHEAAQIYLVEISPILRSIQSESVPNATHLDSIDDLPAQPTFLVANEFFDALPIRQFVRAVDGWSERVVGVENQKLTFGLTAAAPIALLDNRLADTNVGDLIEHCTGLSATVQSIGDRINNYGGAALIIDYGDWVSQGDTLQALQAHKSVDPLSSPGKADLTAHVDFAEIAKAACCNTTKLTSQGVFLERLGITARAQSLANGLSGAALESHIQAHRRLTHPTEMGDLFKVIGLYPSDAQPPAGLNA